MPKKPDRFERTVEKHAHTNQWDMPVIYAHRAAKLLRDEHAWMKRQISEIEREHIPNVHIQAGISIVLDELEYRLAQRRK